MTHRGTNTYLLGETDLAVIDPGPDDAAHLAAILEAVEPGQRIRHILVTHAHRDHSPLARRLSAATGAPVLAYGDARSGRSAVMQMLARGGMTGGGEGVDADFIPDRCLRDGEVIEAGGWRIRAIWTPGHFGNHMCFASGGMIFTGDLVMGWASSLVSPPDGDAAEFTKSCRKLKGLNASVLHPGHGAPVDAPEARLDWLIAHRASREAAILAQLALEPGSAKSLAARIYTETPAALMPAAARNVLAHLIDLATRGAVQHQGSLETGTVFRL